MNPIDHALQVLRSHLSDEVHWKLEIPVYGERKPYRPLLRSNFRLFSLALIPTAQALEKHRTHLSKIIGWEGVEYNAVHLHLLHLVSGNAVIPVDAIIRVPRTLFVEAANPATPLQYLYPGCIRIANKLLPALGVPDVPNFKPDWPALVEQYGVSHLQGAKLFKPKTFYETVLALHFLLSTAGNLKRSHSLHVPSSPWLHRTIGGVLSALSDRDYAVAAVRLAYICSDLMVYMHIRTATRSTSRLYYLGHGGYAVQAARKHKPPQDRVDTYIDLRSSLFLENGGTMPRPWVSIAMEPGQSSVLFVRTELVYDDVNDTVQPHMMMMFTTPSEGTAFLVEATQVEPGVAHIRYTLGTASAGAEGSETTDKICGELVSLGTDVHRLFAGSTQLKTITVYHTQVHGQFMARLEVMPRLPIRTAMLLERIVHLLDEGINVRLPTGHGGVTMRLRGAQLWLASSIGFVLGRPGISKSLVVNTDTAWWERLRSWLTCPTSILVWRWFKMLLKHGPDSAYGKAFHVLTSQKLEPYMALARNLAVRDVSRSLPVENLAQVKYSHPVRGSTIMKRDTTVPEHRYGRPCVVSMEDYTSFVLNTDAERLEMAVELLRYIQPPPS